MTNRIYSFVKPENREKIPSGDAPMADPVNLSNHNYNSYQNREGERLQQGVILQQGEIPDQGPPANQRPQTHLGILHQQPPVHQQPPIHQQPIQQRPHSESYAFSDTPYLDRMLSRPNSYQQMFANGYQSRQYNEPSNMVQLQTQDFKQVNGALLHQFAMPENIPVSNDSVPSEEFGNFINHYHGIQQNPGINRMNMATSQNSNPGINSMNMTTSQNSYPGISSPINVTNNHQYNGSKYEPYQTNQNLYIQSHPTDPTTISTDVIIHNLLISSDYFISKAHSIVLSTNTSQGQDDYFKLIKTSIKSLLILVKKYHQHLNPHLQLYIYFKLAKIYLFETENISKADDYINKSIAIASRNNLVDIKFHSEFLAGQILEKSDTNLLHNYLNDKVDTYSKLGYVLYSTMFQILKFQNLFLDDFSTGLVVLQKLSGDKSVDSLIRVYCLIYQANLQLYRGSPKYSIELLEEAEKLLETETLQGTHVDNTPYPPQLIGMLMIQKYLAYIQTDFQEATRYTRVFSNFVSTQQRLGWKNWSEDGNFPIQVKNSSQNSPPLMYQVAFLNSDEFVINFYFLTGINLLSEIANGKRKSKKVFDKCLQIIDKQLNEMETPQADSSEPRPSRNFPIGHLNQSIFRLRFFRFSINYYQAWMGLLNDEAKAINYLNEFMLDYNEGKFCSEELCYFKLLIPKVFYLFGVYYHSIGDIQAAKYYYIKVRNLTGGILRDERKKAKSEEFQNSIPSSIPSSSRQISYLQLSLGIGCENLVGEQEFNELFIYSSLHLLILTEFEVRMISNETQNDEMGTSGLEPGTSGLEPGTPKQMGTPPPSNLTHYLKLASVLHQDLNQIFQPKVTSNKFNTNFTGSNEILQLTFHIVLKVLDYSTKLSIEELIKFDEKSVDGICFPFFNNLLNYLIYTETTDVVQRRAYLEKCVAVVAKSTSDTERMICIFILRSLIQKFRASGENDKANMGELQLEYFYKKLSDKIVFLRGNVSK